MRAWRQQLREVLAILRRSGAEGLMQARAVFFLCCGRAGAGVAGNLAHAHAGIVGEMEG